MRNLFAFLIAITFIDDPGALVAQNTIPVPLPAPALSLQGIRYRERYTSQAPWQSNAVHRPFKIVPARGGTE
jgi:hypothetical protein